MVSLFSLLLGRVTDERRIITILLSMLLHQVLTAFTFLKLIEDSLLSTTYIDRFFLLLLLFFLFYVCPCVLKVIEGLTSARTFRILNCQ